MINPTPLLEVRGLHRHFGNVHAVNELSFATYPGQITGFIGPNGSGKTTSMRIAATLDIPDAGDVLVSGISVLENPRHARNRLGFMADQFLPYPDLDVEEYLTFFARSFGLRGKALEHTLDGVSEFCGLGSMITRPCTGLSKGMGQRLHLAKTLLHDPQLLLLDEPAAGLDPRARIELRELLKELAKNGKGILISSHILAELSEICDSVVVIEQGELVVAGTTADIGRKMREHHLVRMLVLSDAEEAQRFLLVQPLVKDARITDASSVAFDFEGDENGLADLLQRAIAHGIRIYDFSPDAPNLEEVFLHSTKGRVQ